MQNHAESVAMVVESNVEVSTEVPGGRSTRLC